MFFDLEGVVGCAIFALVMESTAPDKLNVLLMGDFSNYHRCLADGLRRLGHSVTVASNGSRWMDTARDIDISRRFKGKLGGLDLWLRLKRMLNTRLAGYDVVSLASTGFVELRPERTLALFNEMKKRNHSVFLSMGSADSNYVSRCIDPSSPLRYSEWTVNGKPSLYRIANEARMEQWLSPVHRELDDAVYDRCDGVVTALYEYQLVCEPRVEPERLAYGGIPVDTSTVKYVGIPDNPGKVKFFLGRHASRQVEKGTDRLEAAARRVVEAYPDICELEIVENLPYDEYLERLAGAHVVLDQLYSYTPATNALLAMAMGKVVVSGGEPEFYDFIGERELHPIVNAVPDDDEALYASLRDLVLAPQSLAERGRMGHDFVLKHNDVEIVARRFLDFWRSRLRDTKI